MRPLFIVSDLEMGGAQRVVLGVLRHLHGEVLHPELALVSEKGPLSGDLPQNIPIHALKAERVRHAWLKLLRLCWALRPDVVVSTVVHLNVLLLLLKRFLPSGTAVVIREANTPSIRLKHTSHPRLYGFSYRRIYPLSDRLICNCRYMEADLVSNFGAPPDRIAVIRNPVDAKRISSQIRSEPSPYPPGRTDIVSVGRLQYQKGFDLLLRAFKLSAHKIPGIHLTVVGDGPERSSLQSLSEALGISGEVTFAGEKRAPYVYMANADFSVCASRWEGSPNAVLESLACGTPVLAFNCPGGTAEIVDPDRNGWLVPAEDWGSMGEGMTRILSDRSWSALKGKALLPAEYRMENVVKRWEEVLLETRDEKKGHFSP